MAAGSSPDGPLRARRPARTVRGVDGYVEDHLLRLAVVAEVNLEDDVGALRELYLRLARACVAGRGLGQELERDAERELHDAAEAFRVAEGIPEDEPFGFVVTQGPVAAAHQLGLALEALVATAVMTAGEAEAFLRARIEPATSAPPPHRAALDAHLHGVWPSLTPSVRSTLLGELDGAGALSSAQMDVWERRLGDPCPTDDRPDESSWVIDPGAVREAFAVPARRVAGVLVVAVELGTDSTLLHVHVAPDATAPSLFLRDELETPYDGCLPGRFDEEELDEDDSPMLACSFMPGVPHEATQLWLESADGTVRVTLR